MFLGKWNQLLDTSDWSVYDNERLEITKKYWKFGELLYIYKDFQGIEYQGKSWTVEAVEAYTYEWK